MKVGDYVRTKNKAPFEPSQIAKITDMKKDVGYKNQYFITLDHNLPTTYNFHIYSEDVIKSSPNIIDLIEVGDYVNGVIVTQSYIDNIKHIAPEIKENNYGIKSIVTKEQFSCMDYEIVNINLLNILNKGSDKNEIN